MKEIKLSEENYKALLKSLAIGNFIYWIMADIVNDFYKKDAHDSDEVIHQVLKCCNDPKVKDIWDGKMSLLKNMRIIFGMTYKSMKTML